MDASYHGYTSQPVEATATPGENNCQDNDVIFGTVCLTIVAYKCLK